MAVRWHDALPALQRPHPRITVGRNYGVIAMDRRHFYYGLCGVVSGRPCGDLHCIIHVKSSFRLPK